MCRTQLQADRPVPRARLITKHNHGKGGISTVDELQQLDPASIAQVDIEQDEIRYLFR
jgi:hypothetical protein